MNASETVSMEKGANISCLVVNFTLNCSFGFIKQGFFTGLDAAIC